MLRTWPGAGGYLLAELRYPRADNYGGRKLLLLRGVDDAWLRVPGRLLDPHFVHGFGQQDHPVVARFVPTPEGLELALRLLGAAAESGS